MARTLILVNRHRWSLPAAAHNFVLNRWIATDPLGVETSTERAECGMPFMHGKALQRLLFGSMLNLEIWA